MVWRSVGLGKWLIDCQALYLGLTMATDLRSVRQRPDSRGWTAAGKINHSRCIIWACQELYSILCLQVSSLQKTSHDGVPLLFEYG